MKEETKKIPIVKYLCYILAVSVLFTGVTLSRYTSGTSGDISSTLGRFVCSYEIENISALSMANGDYWLSSGNSQNAQTTYRTLCYTVSNYVAGADGAPERISDVDLQPSLRVRIPGEFADNLVFQFAEVNGSTYNYVTPQYVMSDFIYGIGETSGYKDWDAAEEDTLDTSQSTDYQTQGGRDEILTVTGGLSVSGAGVAEGTITATADGYTGGGAGSGNAVTISAEASTERYSVGFMRGESQTDLTTQLYLDLEKEISVYTVDFALPSAYLPAYIAAEKTFVLYITLARRITGSDYGVSWSAETSGGAETAAADGYDYLLTPPTADNADTYTFGGAKVLGYHFNASASTVGADGSARASDTSVRVTKTYDYAGGASVSYSHVAPISENAAEYVHPIEHFYTLSDGMFAEYDGDTGIDSVNAKSVLGLCTNFYENHDPASGSIYYISLAGLTDNPIYSSYTSAGAADAPDYGIYSSLSKEYPTEINVLFVQASESPEAEGGSV